MGNPMNNNFIELERATTDNDACGIENALRTSPGHQRIKITYDR
jgi:hypothetical protein